MPRVNLSAQRSTVVTFFRGFPQFLQANDGMLPQITPLAQDRVLLRDSVLTVTSFMFHDNKEFFE
jgi:hypothetical protein